MNFGANKYMSRKAKLVKRLLDRPKDFSWNELISLLAGIGYQQSNQGKTSGSRCRFVHEDLPMITLHKPHPRKILKRYQLDQVIDILEEEGQL